MQTTPRDAMAGPRRELDRTDPDDLRYNLRITMPTSVYSICGCGNR